MKKQIRISTVIICIIILHLGSLDGYAQIEITWQNPIPFNNPITMVTDTSVNVSSLDIMNTSKHSWTFNSPLPHPWPTTMSELRQIDTTPFADSFAGAEWACYSYQYIPEFEIMEGLAIPAQLDSIFLYRRLSGGWIEELGMGSNNVLIGGSPFIYSKPSKVFPNPMNVSSAVWIERRNLQAQLLGLVSGTVVDSAVITVDGWGDLTIPSGTYPCLRLKRQEYRTITIPPFPPLLTEGLVEKYQSNTFQWITQGFNLVLSVTLDSALSEEAPLVIRAESDILVGIDEHCSPDLCDPKPFTPSTWILDQNYPNPFNPMTTINYVLPQPADVELTIYNSLGQQVSTLISESQFVGTYQVKWNGTDHLGRKLPSGLYLYRLAAKPFTGRSIIQMKKMILGE